MHISDRNLYIISCMITTLGFSVSLLIFGHFVIRGIIGKLIMKKDLYHLDNDEDKYHVIATIATVCNVIGGFILVAMVLVLLIMFIIFVIAVIGGIIYRLIQ